MGVNGLTALDETTNATLESSTGEIVNQGNRDTVTFSYDLADGPLTYSADYETIGAPEDTELEYIILALDGVGSLSPEAVPGFPFISQSTDGIFSYEVTLQEWIDAGSPSEISLTIEDNLLDDDSTDFIFFNLTASCFARGTEIAVPGGVALVETLKIGDVIEAPDRSAIKVRWIGRQMMNKLFIGPHAQPVRIRAGALGDGLPTSDLILTADHGLAIDGLIINAGALVNGDSIDFVPMAELEDTVIVYHIETENHDLILANGTQAETFVDYAGRSAFDNHAEYLDLYGAERIIPEMPTPRISAARLVPETIRRRLGLGADVSPELRQLSA